ncbi:hypothetical protein [Lysinibacillus sp. LZ02]|uniref:hypothetical protein n=1 Tax=Lysinibacillus sp. LZ02 TaxID=3420668 RepID=UPI003D3657AC
MSKSEAKKKRIKLLRQQGKDVTEKRGTADFSTHVRLTKTKKDVMEKNVRKHKNRYEDA